MNLKEVSIDEIKASTCSKQGYVREILDAFMASDMKCAEVEKWETISKTIENFRSLVRNQISYRNGSKYKGIRVVTRHANNEYRVYLIKDGEE